METSNRRSLDVYDFIQRYESRVVKPAFWNRKMMGKINSNPTHLLHTESRLVLSYSVSDRQKRLCTFYITDMDVVDTSILSTLDKHYDPFELDGCAVFLDMAVNESIGPVQIVDRKVFDVIATNILSTKELFVRDVDLPGNLVAENVDINRFGGVI